MYRCLGSQAFGPAESTCEPVSFEHGSTVKVYNLLGGLVTMVSSTTLLHLPHDLGVEFTPAHGFHHGKMLQIVMCLEQCIPGEELHQDATDTPYIARKTPSQIQYDFWCSIVSRRYH